MSDPVNTNVKVVKVASLPNDPIEYTTMETVVTSPHPINQVKRVNKKKETAKNIRQSRPHEQFNSFQK